MTGKIYVCLNASEFTELPPHLVFASRAQILSQKQLCHRIYAIETLFAFFVCFAVRQPQFLTSPSVLASKNLYGRKEKE